MLRKTTHAGKPNLVVYMAYIVSYEGIRNITTKRAELFIQKTDAEQELAEMRKQSKVEKAAIRKSGVRMLSL